MAKLRIVFIVFSLLLIAAAGVFAFCLVPGMTASPSAGVPTSVPTASPVTPVAPGTPVATLHPTASLAADPIVGSWQGSTSIYFGMATADYTLDARPDGTMTIAGIADAPIAGYNDVPFSVEAAWTHKGGSTYVGTIGDRSMEFSCDGSRISLTVNPYAAGLIDNELLDMDIDLALTRR